MDYGAFKLQIPSNSVPTLYLLPSTMSDGQWQQAIPEANVAVAASLRHFVVENVRTARRFLRRCDPAFPIDECSFTVLNVNTPIEDVAPMLEPMRRGLSIGLISEAGCPAVADPGANLVAVAQREGFTVKPLVGPSSIIMSLMASGFNGQNFAFRGYLPIDAKERSAAIHDMERLASRLSQTQIFIETPYRNQKLMADLIAALPDNFRICAATDITGPTEQILTRTVAQWRKLPPPPKAPTIFLIFP